MKNGVFANFALFGVGRVVIAEYPTLRQRPCRDEKNGGYRHLWTENVSIDVDGCIGLYATVER